MTGEHLDIFGRVWYSKYDSTEKEDDITMRFFITTEDCRIVYGRKGPLLRFSLTMGLVEGDNGRKFILKVEGCLGRTVTERDPETGVIISTTKTFTWSLPLMPSQRATARQIATATPDLYEAVLKALREQGAIDAYTNAVKQYEITAIPKSQELSGIKGSGNFYL